MHFDHLNPQFLSLILFRTTHISLSPPKLVSCFFFFFFNNPLSLLCVAHECEAFHRRTVDIPGATLKKLTLLQKPSMSKPGLIFFLFLFLSNRLILIGQI